MRFEKTVESRRMSGAMKEFVALSKSATRKGSLPVFAFERWQSEIFLVKKSAVDEKGHRRARGQRRLWTSASDDRVAEAGGFTVSSFWNWTPVPGLKNSRNMVTSSRLKLDRLHYRYFEFFGAVNKHNWKSYEKGVTIVQTPNKRWEFQSHHR